MRRCAEAFRRCRGGNTGMMMALVAPVLIGLLGGAVDVARVFTAQRQLASAVDSAVLAAASLTQTEDISTLLAEYVNANLPAGSLRDSVVFTFPETQEVSLNSRTVRLSVHAELKMVFLPVFGINDMTVSAAAAASHARTAVEIALVVDVSSSMAGGRLLALKDAAKGFVDRTVGRDATGETSLSLIPFGGTVNIGDLFNTYAAKPSALTLDPSATAYSIGGHVRAASFRFSDGDQCIEHPEDDFDVDERLPKFSRGQVPPFWKWNNYNPWCPPEKSAVVLNTNNIAALNDRIDEFVLSDGTGMDIGALWGAYALSPDWQGTLGGDFPQRPAPYDDSTMKIFVLMTDGNITGQFRPMDYSLYTTHLIQSEIGSNPGAYSGSGPRRQSNVTSSQRNRNQQVILTGGNGRSPLTSDAGAAQFKRVCNHLKAQGTIVFTVGFQISPGGTADLLLSDCASSPSNYFLIESLDLDAAFQAIATSISSLRIIG